MGARFLLLRHGQIKANVQAQWHGSTDSPLNWRGRRQAKRTAKHLHVHNPQLSAIYASPLLRCQNTAAFTARAFGLEVDTHEGLAEMSIGDWEGMSFKALESDHQLIAQLTADEMFAPPGGESLYQVSQRVTAAFYDIDAQHSTGETILVVSHGVALAVAIAHFLEDSPTKWVNYHFNNCSLTEFILSPAPVILNFNQHAHL